MAQKEGEPSEKRLESKRGGFKEALDLLGSENSKRLLRKAEEKLEKDL